MSMTGILVTARRVWRGLWASAEMRPAEPYWVDEQGGMAAPDGLTPGARRWLEDRYPAGTAARVDAAVRAANEATR